MVRLIVLVALVLAATYLMEAAIRRLRRELGDPASRRRIRQPGGAGLGSRSAASADPGDRLVACSLCGVHTPTSRAYWRGKIGPFCSETCRQRAKSAS